MAQCALELRVAKLVARVYELGRVDTDAGQEHLFSEIPQGQSGYGSGKREDGRAIQDAIEGRSVFAGGDGTRHCVDRTLQGVGGKGMEDHAHNILGDEPAPVLPARPDPPSPRKLVNWQPGECRVTSPESDLESGMLDPRLDAQETPGKPLGKHYSEPWMHDPDTGIPGRVRRPLPLLAHPGEKTASRATLLPQELVTPAPVVVDTRDRDHHSGRLSEAGDRLGEQAGALSPTVHDAPLLRRRPMAFPHALRSQVYDGVQPSQARGIENARDGVPANSILRGRLRTAQPDHPMSKPLELHD